MNEMKQYDDRDKSTRVCPCGATFSWSGYDACIMTPGQKDGRHVPATPLGLWMGLHIAHTNGICIIITTKDGAKATGPLLPRRVKL